MDVSILMFKLKIESKTQVEKEIHGCNYLGHFQQVSYSVHGKCLTQICFGCKMIRTNYKGKK